MQTRRRELFTTIRTEGALLPPELLQRIADGDRDLEGLTSEAYHLAANERLGEAVTRSWNRLVGAWAGFRDALAKLPATDHGTSVTRERWLLIVFQELGYGRLPTARAVEIDDRSYPVSHAWASVPIHLVGARIPIDRRTPGVAGAAGQSPHGLLQELLNRSDERLWGFVSNGFSLRVLRDNSSLTRQAYVEFDLEAMMDGEVYSDFVVLWLLCHQSRVEGERPEHCWLERWSQLSAERGTRALESLRAGVEEAIVALGRGFLAHPQNRPLRDALRGGEPSKDEYYRQLLRLVYRLLFLFVAEDRELLLAPDAPSEVQERYARFFSMQRLRRIAEQRRGGKHGDLYDALRLVTRKLGDDDGCPELGLPALGSFLWSAQAVPSLDGAQLANEHLLDAVRALAFIEERGTRRAVDYKNLGSEELGSVYESLLELHPELNVDVPTFELRVAAGHERKTSGSYYTPTSLIGALLDSALDPLLDEAVKTEEPEQAILDLKLCDPACGSGHFLVAAAHRIARRLAAVRTGEVEPSPEEIRRALRDVVSRCLYGVDVNPMAVELCKVALWMEALEPGRPLSFIDSHIKCGNSLLGTTPELIVAGIPDDAFKLIEGDQREVVSSLKRRNKHERQGQLTLDDEIAALEAELTTEAAEFEAASDDSIASLHTKERRYRDLVSSDAYRQARLLADAWCAAFVQPKKEDALAAITSGVLHRLALDPNRVPAPIRTEVNRLARENRFFHWHIEFAAVFDSERDGFDAVVGNPPWERVKLQEKEFFADHPTISAARNAAERKRLIAELAASDPPLDAAWRAALRRADGESHVIRNSGRYPLCGRGDVNTYSIFAELMRSLIGLTGRVGCIVPLGIATDDTTKYFFSDLVRGRSLVSLFGFENEEFIFPAVHHSTKFALLTATGRARPAAAAEFVFFARQVTALTDAERRFTLSADDFALLNPNTGTCPIFRTARDAELTKAIYRRLPVLLRESEPDGNPWGVSFKAMFHMANDSGLFHPSFAAGRVPLYEGKMVHLFDHRFGTYEGQTASQAAQGKLPEFTDEQHADPDLFVVPRDWVDEREVDARVGDRWGRRWLLGWRDIARNTDARTVIAGAIPRTAVGDTFLLALPSADEPLAMLVANLSSFVLDYAARQKVGGTHLKYHVFQQLPILDPGRCVGTCAWAALVRLTDWVGHRVLELTYTAWDMEPFARDHGWVGPPFRWNRERRFLLRCELDAAFFHLYGLEREDVAYVMETFPVVRRRDEQAHGEYRTKRTILRIYDALAEAAATGHAYQTVLHPPPADPSLAHPGREEPPREAVVVPFPFRRLRTRPADVAADSLAPIYTLRAAAGAFGAGEAVEPDGWAELNGKHRIRAGMFVAQVRGHSMEPRVRDGAWCLFATPVEGSRDGRILLVEHRAIDDPDNGGSYTVKRYRSRKRAVEGELWEHEEIVLEPLNPEHEPIVLRDVEDGEFRVIAELVEVLG
jgi:hypothetical protein